MDVHLDAVGNLRGRLEGNGTSTKTLLLGSHLDTVPNGGAYDGIIGVVLGVVLIEALGERRLPFAIEVVGFSEEEGVRFGFPFIGSKAVVGELSDEFLARKDARGLTVADAIQDYGLDIATLPEAKIQDRLLAYLEFHIEQGPWLEGHGDSLACVSAIVGQSRLEVSFVGKAGHAGTTPMAMRSDALMAAAEWLAQLETFALKKEGLTITVGSVKTIPGATNVIPGEVIASLDVRHKDDAVRTSSVRELLGYATRIVNKRGLTFESRLVLEQPTVPMDSEVREELRAVFLECGFPPHEIVSGAGHDAMVLAPHHPSAMIFLRSPNGISHHPSEAVLVQDVEAAIQVGLRFLDQLQPG
jgi:allantoate deiminase